MTICSFIDIDVGNHFKFKKGITLYQKTGLYEYTNTRNKEKITLSVNHAINTKVVKAKRRKQLIPRKDVVQDNITAFFFLKPNDKFKWLFFDNDKVYTKTGFKTYTGLLTVRNNKVVTVEYTLISPLYTEMELIRE